MKKLYNARDRTVLRNNKDGLSKENLRTGSIDRISNKGLAISFDKEQDAERQLFDRNNRDVRFRGDNEQPGRSKSVRRLRRRIKKDVSGDDAVNTVSSDLKYGSGTFKTSADKSVSINGRSIDDIQTQQQIFSEEVKEYPVDGHHFIDDIARGDRAENTIISGKVRADSHKKDAFIEGARRLSSVQIITSKSGQKEYREVSAPEHTSIVSKESLAEKRHSHIREQFKSVPTDLTLDTQPVIGSSSDKSLSQIKSRQNMPFQEGLSLIKPLESGESPDFIDRYSFVDNSSVYNSSDEKNTTAGGVVDLDDRGMSRYESTSEYKNTSKHNNTSKFKTASEYKTASKYMITPNKDVTPMDAIKLPKLEDDSIDKPLVADKHFIFGTKKNDRNLRQYRANSHKNRFGNGERVFENYADSRADKTAKRKLRQKRRYKKMYLRRFRQGADAAVGITNLIDGAYSPYSDNNNDAYQGIQPSTIPLGIAGGIGRGRLGAVVSKENEMTAFLFGALVLLICFILSAFSGCGAILNGGAAIIATTYPGSNEDIWSVEDAYNKLEKDLDNQINSMETAHPGMDEYIYQVDEITHNPFQLTSLLTALLESYKPDEVTDTLSEILNLQYSLSVREKTEVREKEVKDPVTGEIETEEYECRILYISLTNHGLDYAAKRLLTAEQYALYESYFATKGNRKDLFDENAITINPQGGANGGESYQVPPEALSDERFRRMLNEAEKYLGYPYVWGGSTPQTSFDCSGFVSWVVNHCGNGWNVGRQTAEGLRKLCTPVSIEDARPGDLIFFQGTYNTSGASHIGIYVGNGMMIHAGKPIQYSNVNTPYFKSHFFQYGRLP